MRGMIWELAIGKVGNALKGTAEKVIPDASLLWDAADSR